MTVYITEKCVWCKNNMHPSLPVSPNSQRQGSTHNMKPDRLV